MSKKTIVAFVVVVLVLIGMGSFFLAGNKQTVPEADLVNIDPGDVVITPETYDLGKVLMKGGLVEKEYKIKNNSQNILRVKKLSTSCMCTRASVQLGDLKTRFYSMEMSGDRNPNINFDIPGGEEAKLVVRFDPAAHGISGKGQFDRNVFISFAGETGTKEVGFSGEVTLQ